MTRIKIKQLIWDEWNVEHIKKHNLSQDEIEEAIKSVNAHREGYDGRVVLIGRSGKRILSIIVVHEKDNKYYIITGRDADRKERRLLYEQEQKENS